MCVLAFAWKAHPRWHLVMAGNRDELHARGADPLSQWPESQVIAGRDIQAGGTWAGVGTGGRFAVVTNLRGYGLPIAGRHSRGDLVIDMLSETESSRSMQSIQFDRYNPFNLIVADQRRAWFLSNRPEARCEELSEGVLGLANGELDEAWPRTVQLRDAMQDWLDADALDPALLLAALREECLPSTTGDATTGETAHAPVFIRNPIYGTRCSTVIAIARDGAGTIMERRFDMQGKSTGDTEIAFRWQMDL